MEVQMCPPAIHGFIVARTCIDIVCTQPSKPCFNQWKINLATAGRHLVDFQILCITRERNPFFFSNRWWYFFGLLRRAMMPGHRTNQGFSSGPDCQFWKEQTYNFANIFLAMKTQCFWKGNPWSDVIGLMLYGYGQIPFVWILPLCLVKICGQSMYVFLWKNTIRFST